MMEKLLVNVVQLHDVDMKISYTHTARQAKSLF